MWIFISYFLIVGIIYSICQDLHWSVGESAFTAFLWPITLPLAAGIKISEKIKKSKNKK